MTTAAKPQHVTHIEHLPHLGKWQPYCDQCGNIGATQDLFDDAVAIADRHEEIGGFERRCEVLNPRWADKRCVLMQGHTGSHDTGGQTRWVEDQETVGGR